MGIKFVFQDNSNQRPTVELQPPEPRLKPLRLVKSGHHHRAESPFPARVSACQNGTAYLCMFDGPASRSDVFSSTRRESSPFVVANPVFGWQHQDQVSCCINVFIKQYVISKAIADTCSEPSRSVASQDQTQTSSWLFSLLPSRLSGTRHFIRRGLPLTAAPRVLYTSTRHPYILCSM